MTERLAKRERSLRVAIQTTLNNNDKQRYLRPSWFSFLAAVIVFACLSRENFIKLCARFALLFLPKFNYSKFTAELYWLFGTSMRTK